MEFHKLQCEECSICLECFTDRNISITECNHTFHTKCLLKSGGICPLCRNNLIPVENKGLENQLLGNEGLENQQLETEDEFLIDFFMK